MEIPGGGGVLEAPREQKIQWDQGQIWGEGAGGAPPPPPEMKLSSSYSLLNFFCLTVSDVIR